MGGEPAADTVVFVVAKGKSVVETWAVEVGSQIIRLDEIPNDPAVTFTVTPADATAIRCGELDLSVGFMRGQIKMAGDFAALFRILPRSGALHVA